VAESTYRADLLSDTLTRPSEAMRLAMARAEVGDDVFGEDPTLRALEERVADLLGHEAGLFTPSGSMANQLGVRLHVRPGEELVGDSLAHVVRAELGAAAVLSGISSRTWVSERGRFRADDAASLMITERYDRETLMVLGIEDDDMAFRMMALQIVSDHQIFTGKTLQDLSKRIVAAIDKGALDRLRKLPPKPD